MGLPARPDSVGQGRLLRLLRDEGSKSRAELAELANMTRSKLEAELTRLTASLEAAYLELTGDDVEYRAAAW